MDLLIKNANVFGKLKNIYCKDGVIEEYDPRTFCENILDVNGSKVFPGLIDIHTHGCGGADVMDGNSSYISKILKSHGTTSFCPTTMTMPKASIEKICAEIPDTKDGAHFLGYNIEGPFVSRGKCGAQNPEYLIDPDIRWFNSLKNTAIAVLAPELENSEEFIKSCKAKVSIGHTNASYEQALKAIKSGANSLTHTFNAMPEPHHRNKSVIDAALDENIYVQLICDGFHNSKTYVRFLFGAFGSGRVILISDSLAATGYEDGRYNFGNQQITVKDRKAYLDNGSIAGSTSFLIDCVKKAIEFGVSEYDAFTSATKTPADYLGIKKGRIEPGFDADFIVTDNDYNILKVISKEQLI